MKWKEIKSCKFTNHTATHQVTSEYVNNNPVVLSGIGNLQLHSPSSIDSLFHYADSLQCELGPLQVLKILMMMMKQQLYQVGLSVTVFIRKSLLLRAEPKKDCWQGGLVGVYATQQGGRGGSKRQG